MQLWQHFLYFEWLLWEFENNRIIRDYRRHQQHYLN
jgi:hypothetical protein